MTWREGTYHKQVNDDVSVVHVFVDIDGEGRAQHGVDEDFIVARRRACVSAVVGRVLLSSGRPTLRCHGSSSRPLTVLLVSDLLLERGKAHSGGVSISDARQRLFDFLSFSPILLNFKEPWPPEL